MIVFKLPSKRVSMTAQFAHLCGLDLQKHFVNHATEGTHMILECGACFTYPLNKLLFEFINLYPNTSAQVHSRQFLPFLLHLLEEVE